MNIIVTGASRGIGYQVVKAFAEDKDNNILAIARNKPALNELKRTCRSEGLHGKVFSLPYDLGTPELEKGLEPRINAYFSHVDLLINIAGTMVNKPFFELNDQDFDALFNVNVRSVFKLCQIVTKLMKPGAHIINVSSMGGFQGSTKFPGLSLYSSSKGAVSILSECLAEELKPAGISVNCLALGAVQTEMLEEAFPGYEAKIDPYAMSRFIKAFASGGQLFMNGKVLPVSPSVP